MGGKVQSRLQLARSALQMVEGSHGVRSYAHRTLQEESVISGVYEVEGGVPMLISALASLMTAEKWAGVVGVRDVGWEAAQGMGVDLSRIVEVSCAPEQGASVLATLLEGFEIMVVGQVGLSAAQQRTLAARARMLERIVLTTTNWPLSSSLFPGALAARNRHSTVVSNAS